MKQLFALILILLIAGCTTQDAWVSECVNLCLDAQSQGMDLSEGPCLSNDYYPNYVCDVAHNPRINIDNLPENQCSAYGVTAYHYVEVDENCNLIASD